MVVLNENLVVGIEDGEDYLEFPAMRVELTPDQIQILFDHPLKVDLWNGGGKFIVSCQVIRIIGQIDHMENQP